MRLARSLAADQRPRPSTPRATRRASRSCQTCDMWSWGSSPLTRPAGVYASLPQGALPSHRLVCGASSSEPPTSMGLACRPVGAWRRPLMKQLDSNEGRPGHGHTFIGDGLAAVSRTRAARRAERHVVSHRQEGSTTTRNTPLDLSCASRNASTASSIGNRWVIRALVSSGRAARRSAASTKSRRYP